MANPEKNIGQDVRNVGLVIAALGVISLLVESLALPTNKLIFGGGVLAVAGEIYSRTRK